MSAVITQTLTALRDVQGIEGSFIIGESGGLIAKELPAIFNDSLFSELGARINRLKECFLSNGDDMESGLLKFSDHKLYLRTVTKGTLGIITSSSVNMPALRMAVNLALRRVNPELEKGVPEMNANGTAAAPAAEAPKKFRMFRGNLVEM
jgi:predicted regulator of Ras-like GTPase activity (Roadblock/LC7/MglB family)